MAGIEVPIQVNLPDDWVEQIVNRLRNDPDAEWAEIVRCKYCKHSMNNENGEPWICAHPNNNAWRITPDHYCGYADMREDQDG